MVETGNATSHNSINLPFDPSEFPRELKSYYISASEDDLTRMLGRTDLADIDSVYSHILPTQRFGAELNVPEELSYPETCKQVAKMASKTHLKPSFIGDMLPVWQVDPIVQFVSKLRPLSTSYTPYQPERSQGTLVTHWIYQCALSALTGFEAINTSLYDRSFAMYEAITCAIRTNKRPKKVLLAKTLFYNDLQVLQTLTKETGIEFTFLNINSDTGLLDYTELEKITPSADEFAGFVFPQVNSLGLLEDVDLLTDFCATHGIRSIASIDPSLLATGGLKDPASYGKKGADYIVGDAQHLATGPTFGGPGLGLFGCRYNNENKRDIRHTPGRFIGKAKDINGRDCFVMVLSTREQHIRKEKATSNVCSNQAFLATLAGANLLAKGDKGLEESLASAISAKNNFINHIDGLEGVSLAFPHTDSCNEVVLSVDYPVEELLEKARQSNLHVGVNVSDRTIATDTRNLLKLTFTDVNGQGELQELHDFFSQFFPSNSSPQVNSRTSISSHFLRKDSPLLPSFSTEEISHYYEKLAELNVSPDDGCYPLGSCTMKYNPLVNDWAAGLDGFTLAHPQMPEEDAQGPLSVLYEIQEWFKGITGLAGVTTQPVAGAQGELVGLKMFQAYHRDRGEAFRNKILIPRSAHGTNFATAAMAGYPDGIVYLEAGSDGTIDMEDFHQKLDNFGSELCGVMITNPNTSGIFEKNFQEISQAVHDAGGLVYMDGANMNAIAGIVNLDTLGVDAVHNNLHKTWTIPHGGGGPGDAIVAVSEKLVDFLPGKQIKQNENGSFVSFSTSKSIGDFHRHWGNFGHKVRAYTYLLRLGKKGIPQMSSVAVLAARYLLSRLKDHYCTLPNHHESAPRMHEFILTLSDEEFSLLEKAGIPKSKAIPQIGKLFLDFGFHAPTVAFPEIYGLMIEPTESFTKSELDRFADAVIAIKELILTKPKVLISAPHFTPIDKVDEVSANRNLLLRESIQHLPALPFNRIKNSTLMSLSIGEIKDKVVTASEAAQSSLV